MTDRKKKILFYGDAPNVATGFGSVSRNILMPLYKTGEWDIEVLGVNYYGEPHDFFPMKIWPIGYNSERDPYGRVKIQQQIKTMDFDVLFMIQDSFILEFVKDFIPDLKAMGKKFKSIIYFPVDGVPKKSWIEAMSVADVPVTYTEFGRKECISKVPEIADKLRVIPHGVNTGDFYPLDYGQISDFRSKYFGPFFDKFIFCNLNRNQQRKDFPRTMMAFKEFKKIHPDSFLYCHCAVRDQGWDLEKVAESMGLVVGKDVAFPQNFGPNKGYPVNIVNLIYNSVDAVISTCLGEGWGLSSVEAMATRTPVIFPANTSLPEILGDDRGLLVKSGETINDYTVLTWDNEVVRPLTSVSDMVDKMCLLYENEYLRTQLADNAYNWVVNMDWERDISPMWMKLILEAYTSLVSSSGPAASKVSATEI